MNIIGKLKNVFPTSVEMAEQEIGEVETYLQRLEGLALYHQNMADKYRQGVSRLRTPTQPQLIQQRKTA